MNAGDVERIIARLASQWPTAFDDPHVGAEWARYLQALEYDRIVDVVSRLIDDPRYLRFPPTVRDAAELIPQPPATATPTARRPVWSLDDPRLDHCARCGRAPTPCHCRADAS